MGVNENDNQVKDALAMRAFAAVWRDRPRRMCEYVSEEVGDEVTYSDSNSADRKDCWSHNQMYRVSHIPSPIIGSYHQK